jgi:hypothetical protein
MTTFVPFTPSPREAFSFSANMDGTACQFTVTWNVYGQRWYLTCATGNGRLVFHRAMVGSPCHGEINLAWGYFSVSTLIFRIDTQNFEITP